MCRQIWCQLIHKAKGKENFENAEVERTRNVSGGTLKLGTNSNNLQVLANAGSTGGNAGTIVINPFSPGGNISIETANAVSAAASTGANANSKGGNITLIASPNLSVVSSLSGAAIIVDGKGTGDAGTIKISGNGTLKLGSVAGALTLSAKALDTGNGGTIEIAYTTDLTISDTLSVAGGIATGSNGKGGTINIHDLGAFTTSAFITADGRGTGDGGTITISSSAFNQMKFNGATVSASADTYGSASASDNAVTILNAGEILMQNTFVNAIGAGSGDGGTIRIEVTSANSPKLDLNGLGTFINAFGGDDGLGGKFISGNVLTFPVPDVVTVRAGANKAISDFNGSITLNLVLCQQWKTPYAPSWPSVYWNCSNPTSPDADDEIHVGQAAGFISSIRTMMNSPSTHLFVFDDPMGYRRFFGKTTAEVPDAAGGHTFNLGNMIFTSVNRHFVALSGYRATTSIELTELSSHELTHAIDIRKSLQSHTATWINFVKNDFLTLDYSVVGTSAATSTKRPPCSTNNTGALDGVIDNNTFATFCDPLNPGQLKASYTVGGVTPSNSKLLLDAQEYIFAPVSGGFYMEIYAQAGAFEYYVHTLPPSLYVFPTADGIFARGYFACTRAWASAVLAGSFTPPASPASCSSVAPAWYIPQQ
ncbi:MAG: hypothetical protein J0H83_17850 [Candidatus Melainabacteria bacterium]|nr:hypothetical protein [Candidatus Melainabacteria bacterium]